MPTLDDVSRVAAGLPGSDERTMTSGLAWFVRNKQYALEAHPWPSIPADVRAIIAAEPVVGVKLPDELDALALAQTWPDVFLPRTTSWGGPKIAFRLNAIDPQHLEELVTDAWRVQAPRYLRREFDGDEGAGSLRP
ncbi:MAG: hypothetical protein ABWY55_01250 [Microbacterium sp.]